MQKNTWVELLQEARELRAKGAVLSWQRAKKLKAVSEQEGFQQHCQELGKTTESVLNEEIGDLCCKWPVLMAILEAFPRRQQWESERLDVLAAKAVEMQRAKNVDLSPTRDRPSWKQRYEDLEQQYNDLLQQYEDVCRELENAKKVTVATGSRTKPVGRKTRQMQRA